jgi:hypothetical protein
VDNTGSWQLDVVPVAGGKVQTIYQQSSKRNLQGVNLTEPVWGPGDQLAVPSAREPLNAEVLVLDVNGKVERKVQPVVGEVGLILWYPNTPRILAAGQNGEDELIGSNGQQTVLSLPGAWSPQCLSPSSSSLLVTDGRRAGVWDIGASSHVEVLGKLPSSMLVQGCAWVDAPPPGV